MTRKELIERGYIDQYVLGLTTEEESTEVERMANLYPEIQLQINDARHKLCSNFNRKLTQPALRNTFMTKRRIILWAGLVVSFFSIGFCFLCREHFYLQENYTMQQQQLAREKAKVIQLASFTRMASEQSDFLHSPETDRIKLRGVESFPEAEVMVFQNRNEGKMMLRVIDLPELSPGQYYEIWVSQPEKGNYKIGQLFPPVRFDSLYSLAPSMDWATLEIVSFDPVAMTTTPVCTSEDVK